MNDAKGERSLYNRADRMQSILSDLRELVGDEDEELLHDTYEGETGFFSMVDDVLAVIDSDEMIIEGITRSIERQAARKKRKQSRVDRLKAFLTLTLTEAGLNKCERPTATLTVRLGQPKLAIVNEMEIPSQFWKRSEPKLDRAGLNKTMKERMAAQADARRDHQNDDGALKKAFATIEQEMPPISGVELAPAEQQISIRRA